MDSTVFHYNVYAKAFMQIYSYDMLRLSRLALVSDVDVKGGICSLEKACTFIYQQDQKCS